MSEQTAAYVIGHITVKDAEKWKVYCSKIPATLVPWDAKLVFRGKRLTLMSGEHNHIDTVVLHFPNAGAVNGWFNSSAYQALISLREQAADIVLVSYESTDR